MKNYIFAATLIAGTVNASPVMVTHGTTCASVLPQTGFEWRAQGLVNNRTNVAESFVMCGVPRVSENPAGESTQYVSVSVSNMGESSGEFTCWLRQNRWATVTATRTITGTLAAGSGNTYDFAAMSISDGLNSTFSVSCKLAPKLIVNSLTSQSE